LSGLPVAALRVDLTFLHSKYYVLRRIII